MTSISETGHAKNVANFQDLISFCQGYGEPYNPFKESLKIPQLQTHYQLATNTIILVHTQKTTFSIATNERRTEFADLKPLATRIINAFAVSGADPQAIANAKSINKKIQGTTPKNKNKDENTQTISTAQLSYDRLIDHFINLLQILQQSTTYTPNEPELQLTSLQTKLTKLQTKNTNLINAYTTYSNALIQRNQVLYHPLTGLIQTAREVKLYVKSLFGSNSPQYRQISGLEFKIRKEE